MMGKTHVMVGLAAGMLVASFCNTLEMPVGFPSNSYEPLYLMGLAIGSLGPDIDHPKGFINARFDIVKDGKSKALFYGFLAVLCLLGYYQKRYIPFLIPVPFLLMVAISKHRGITHSALSIGILLTGSLFSQTLSIFGSMYWGVVIGWGLHILTDMFNPQGVELFFPCDKNFRMPLTIDTNKSQEKLLQIFSVVLIIYQGVLMII